VPCVGDGEGKYLTKQMKALDAQSGGLGELPYVLRDYDTGGSSRDRENLQVMKQSLKTVPFGEPRIELLDTWRELQVMYM
jgi:hypothetical protein